MKLLKEEQRLCEGLRNKNGLSISLGNQAMILKDLGRLEEARELHKKKQQICEELGNKVGLRSSLGKQALILKDLGRFEEARELHEKEQQICKELDDKNELAISMMNQALLLDSKMGEADKALPLAEEAYKIASQHSLHALAAQIKPILESVRSKLG